MKIITNFGKHVLWILLITFVFILLSINSKDKLPWTPIEQFIVDTLSPVQELIVQTVNITNDVWLKYFYLVNLSEKNKELEKEIKALKLQNARYREMVASFPRIEKLLDFTRKYKWPVVAAQVIGWDPSGFFKSVTIDKGKSSGLDLDMPVVNADGVVGRIVAISQRHAKVLLIIDQNSAVDCIDQRTRDRGMVHGGSNTLCEIEYVEKSSDVKKGDIIVTSSLGGIFPKGIPIGKVIEVKENQGMLFKYVKMKPFVDFSKLEEVLVITKGQEEQEHHD